MFAVLSIEVAIFEAKETDVKTANTVNKTVINNRFLK
jgi:hypothetical protein